MSLDNRYNTIANRRIPMFISVMIPQRLAKGLTFASRCLRKYFIVFESNSCVAPFEASHAHCEWVYYCRAIDANTSKFIDRLREAVAIQSISADPGHRQDVIKMIDWASKSGKLYGRGATDDKGPIMGWINAIETFQSCKIAIPVNIKVFFARHQILSHYWKGSLLVFHEFYHISATI
ncbi:unnamed protein product [Toxocara canis]|uniref:SCP domain-containing protein n=1 Tax=Toxocara canis TaxID=6265 RepID=A0A183V1U8_TOXCA|nr:unnamed protein product [Toxocara canis]